MIRFILSLLAAMATFNVALADEIPKPLKDHLRILQIAETSLSGGVLRSRFTRPIVTQEIFRSYVRGICTPLWLDRKKDGWRGAKIERIEAVNQIAAQGYALPNTKKACAELGSMPGGMDKENAYINKSAWVCVAGNPCRPRRPGESTSGD